MSLSPRKKQNQMPVCPVRLIRLYVFDIYIRYVVVNRNNWNRVYYKVEDKKLLEENFLTFTVEDK